MNNKSKQESSAEYENRMRKEREDYQKRQKEIQDRRNNLSNEGRLH